MAHQANLTIGLCAFVTEPVCPTQHSIAQYYISLYLGWEIDDQYKNPNMNNKDHLVGQLTNSYRACGCK